MTKNKRGITFVTVSRYRFRGNTVELATIPRGITAAVGSSTAGNPQYSRRPHYRAAL